MGGEYKLVKFTRDKLLYLTYFNNFDLVTKKDTPIKGPQITYSPEFSFSKTTMSCMNVQVPALQLICSLHNPPSPSLISVDIPPSTNTISVEAFTDLRYSSSPNSGANIGTDGLSSSTGSDPRGWWGSGWIGGVTSYIEVQVFNGATLVTDQGNIKYIRLPFYLDNQIHHVAIVCNFTSREVRHYIDGRIYARYIKDLDIQYKGIIYVKPSLGWTCYITQAAIFTMDKSINGGMDYPIPTTPYDPGIVMV